MTTSEAKFEELRDILLWQQLNRQLIELRDGGAPISESNQKTIQRFCFENELFQRLTEDPLIEWHVAVTTFELSATERADLIADSLLSEVEINQYVQAWQMFKNGSDHDEVDE